MSVFPFFLPVLAVIALILLPRSGRWGVNFAKTNCVKCGAAMPRIRRPTSWRQAFWGGWTCPKCGCEMDKYGKEIDEPVDAA